MHADPEVLLPEVHPIKFDSSDAESARKAKLKTKEGAGPLGLGT